MKLINLKASDVKNIVISRTDKIGDLILSIPAISMVNKLFPMAKITVIANSYNYRVISMIDTIDDIILIDKVDENELIKELKTNNVDIFIALYTDRIVGRIAKKSGAKIRIAPLSKLHSFFRYNYGLRQKRSRSMKNEAEYNLDLVKLLDKDRFDTLLNIEKKITYTKDNADVVSKFLDKNNVTKKFIIINPFSGGSAKNLTINQYWLLASEVKKLLPDISIVITASEFERDKLQPFYDYKDFIIYINNDNLLNLTALIDSCSLFIGGSTGATHIAGNLRKLAVGFYPANHNQGFNRWGLFGNENNTLYIVPDDKDEDMIKNKLFNNICDDDIKTYAKKIVGFYDKK